MIYRLRFIDCAELNIDFFRTRIFYDTLNILLTGF